MRQLRAVATLLMLVSLAFFSSVKAQPPAMEIDVSYTDGATAPVHFYFGLYSGGNYCQIVTDAFPGNPLHHELGPGGPPAPPYGAVFALPRSGADGGCWGNGSVYDYRNLTAYGQSDSFKVGLYYQPDDIIQRSITVQAGAWQTYVQSLYFVEIGEPGSPHHDLLGSVGTPVPVDLGLVNGTQFIKIYMTLFPPPTPVFTQSTNVMPFGPVMVGNTADLTVSLSNTGLPGAADIHVLTAISSNPLYTLVPPIPSGTLVVGDPAQVYTLRFTPTAIASSTGTLTFTHDGPPLPAPNDGIVAYNGQGTGITQVNPLVLHFGNVHFLDTGDQTVTVSNASAVLPFDVTSIGLPAGGQYTVTPSVPLTVPPLGNQVFHVIYTPTALGLSGGNVTFNFSVAEGPTDVAVDGTGVTAFQMTAGPVHFPNTYQGSTASDNSISITNNATTGTMHINAIAPSGVFSVTNPVGAFDIAPGASQVLSLQFAPTAVGFASGSFSVVHNGGGAAGSLGVDGTGLLTVSATNAAFGTVTIQSPPICVTPYPTMPVTVTNNGPTPVDITGAAPSPADYTVVPNPPVAYPITLAGSGGSYTFDVTFAPTATGVRLGTVTFGLTGIPATVLSNLTGTGQNCIEAKFITLIPDSMTKLNPPSYYFQTPVLRNPRAPKFPNWTNLMSEVVTHGGFSPASSESDVAGGMRIGKAYMRLVGFNYVAKYIKSDTAWARLTRWIPSSAKGINWGFLQQTLKTRVGAPPPTLYTHDNYARGFDYTKNPGDPGRILQKGQLSILSPRFTKNKLFAEMVALKFNIAGNDLGRMGSSDSYGLFGGLIINLPGNPLNGLSIRAASALIDQYMTFEGTATPTFFDDAYACVYAINRAFVGPLDTTYSPGLPNFQNGSFFRDKILHVNGVAGAGSTGGFLTPGPERPVIVTATNNDEESVYGVNEDDPSILDPDATIASMKLYQNYPNPFNPSTFINFNIAQPSEVTVKVYSVLGQEIATLLNNETLVDGYQSFSFDARGLASGVYYYIVSGRDLESGTEMPRSVGKMLLVK